VSLFRGDVFDPPIPPPRKHATPGAEISGFFVAIVVMFGLAADVALCVLAFKLLRHYLGGGD
jgi:hypothetical protein